MEPEQPERSPLAHATSTAATKRRLVGRCDGDEEFIDPSDQFPGV
jgi:hypothetical protein